jgi:hypothetical protein
VRNDLAKIPEVKDVRTDLGTKTCQILLKDKDFDIKAKLEELAKTNDHLEGWSFKES